MEQLAGWAGDEMTEEWAEGASLQNSHSIYFIKGATQGWSDHILNKTHIEKHI